MAIVIPSSKTYDKDNKKVLDNIIDRIELPTKQINKTVDYSTTAYTEEKPYLEEQQVDLREWDDDDFVGRTNSEGLRYGFVACNVLVKTYYNEIPEFVVPKHNKNTAIKKFSSLEYAILGVKKTYNCTGTYTTQSNHYSRGYFSSSYTLTEQTNEEEINGTVYEKNFENSITGETTATNGLSVKAEIEVVDWSSVPQTYEEYKDYYLFKNIKVLAKKEVLKLKATGDNAGTPGQKWQAYGTYVEDIPESIKLIVNGDIYTIDINETTAYVPETDKTSKKVFTVDGNELMQKGNYNFVEGEKFVAEVDYKIVTNVVLGTREITFLSDYAIRSRKRIKYNETFADLKEFETFYFIGGKDSLKGIIKLEPTDKSAFEKTRQLYLEGKETATIRCSISDYYDYASNDKIIAIDNATSKMSFNIGDQVIPMVYGADGKDRPMSTYQDGTAKVFQVLGTNIFYDGAVWQELSLQEV